MTKPISSMKRCRACGSTRIGAFLDLGEHPLANGFLNKSDLSKDEYTHELRIFRCLDCGMMQSVDFVPKKFFTDYVYMPSKIKTMVRHFEKMADDLAKRHKIDSGSVVVDIGCNDCTLLNRFNKYSSNCIGVDPAKNITQKGKEHGVKIVSQYFGTHTIDLVLQAAGSKADLIMCNNTYHHIGPLDDFTEAVAGLLHEDGSFVVELPFGLDIIKGTQFDGFYHEHLSQFTCKAIDEQLKRHGLIVVDVEKIDVHGNSFRVTAGHQNKRTQSSEVISLIQEEIDFGICETNIYDDFANRTEKIKEDLLKLLHDIISKGGKISGYGASARGNTLLNYCGIGSEILKCIYDANTLKQGLYTPQSRLLVKDPDALKEDECEYLLLLAWNFESEIRGQLKHFIDRGGKFIIPLPVPMIV